MSSTRKLWAPWRLEYILAEKPSGCIFCYSPDVDRKEALLVYEGEHAFVMLNKFPYNNGHLMVAPKKHVAELTGLDEGEYDELMKLVKASSSVLKKALSPDGINVGMNIGKAAGAGIEAHIHMHLVPRWEGDTNFMPVLTDTRVMPEHLTNTYDKLEPFFRELSVK